MFRFILENEHYESLEVDESPLGVDEMGITFERSETYGSVILSYLSGLKYVGSAKRFIDNIFFNYGHSSKVFVTIYIYNSKIFNYEVYYKGILNFETLAVTEYTTECDIVNGDLELIIKTRDTADIEYDSLETLDGTTIQKYADEFENIYLDYIGGTVTKGILPRKIFERLLWSMANKKILFKSDFFDYLDTTLETSFGKYMMLTLGAYLSNNPDKKTQVSFKKIFESYRDIFGLGMGVEIDDLDNKSVRIDTIDTFFIPEIVAQIETLNDLSISLNEEVHFSKMSVGYNRTDKVQDSNLDVEFNTKTDYVTPISNVKKELSLFADVRTDYTSIKSCLDNPHTVGKEGKNDDIMYLLSCKKENGLLKVKDGSDYDLALSNSPKILNADISPRRIIDNNFHLFGILKTHYGDKKLKYVKSDSGAYLKTKLLDENTTKEDFKDIYISDLQESFLSPYKAEFNAPIDKDTLDNLMISPNGLIKFFNVIRNRYEYGWIKVASTGKIIDKTTNWVIWMANEKFYAKFDLLGYGEGGLVQTGKKEFIKVQ